MAITLSEQRFIKQLNKLNKLYEKNTRPDVLKLYTSDARTPLFMLESLCRIYRKFYPKTTFDAQLTYYKKLEDAFGVVDYYEVFARETTNSAAKKRFLIEKKKAENSLKALYIKNKKNTGPIRLQEFRKALDKVKWMKNEKEVDLIRKFIKKQFVKIKKGVASGELHFRDMESGVHEIRRKLRWISIYGQSLNGLIEVKPSQKKRPRFKKYKTKKVLESPFNVLPVNKELKKKIYFDADHFFALSWIISELGIIKDEGLMMHATNKVMGTSATEVQRKKEEALLNKAKTITIQFFADFDTAKFLS